MDMACSRGKVGQVEFTFVSRCENGATGGVDGDGMSGNLDVGDRGINGAEMCRAAGVGNGGGGRKGGRTYRNDRSRQNSWHRNSKRKWSRNSRSYSVSRTGRNR